MRALLALGGRRFKKLERASGEELEELHAQLLAAQQEADDLRAAAAAGGGGARAGGKAAGASPRCPAPRDGSAVLRPGGCVRALRAYVTGVRVCACRAGGVAGGAAAGGGGASGAEVAELRRENQSLVSQLVQKQLEVAELAEQQVQRGGASSCDCAGLKGCAVLAGLGGGAADGEWCCGWRTLA